MRRRSGFPPGSVGMILEAGRISDRLAVNPITD